MRSPCCVALLVLASACGPKPPQNVQPPTDPPQVFITLPKANVYGTELAVKVSVTGCDQVTSASIYNVAPGGAEQLIKNFTFTGSPTPVTLLSNEIPYNVAGIAAQLSLKAKATCDDGRTNFSQAIAATFFPVAQVVSHGGNQVLPDAFVADGYAANVLFYGCSGSSTPGVNMLVRVNATGDVTGTNDTLPHACSAASQITPRNNPSGKRWLYQPGAGAFAFDANLTTSGSSPGSADGFGLLANGDAIIFEGGSGIGLARLSHTAASSVTWTQGILGIVAGTPTFRTNFGLYVPELVKDISTGDTTFVIQALDVNSGAAINEYDLVKWQNGIGDQPYTPSPAFNPDVSLVYVPVPVSANQAQVWACATTGPCNGANLRWKVDLEGPISTVVPFHGGTKLAAVGPFVTFFLDASTGQVLNPAPIRPDLGLLTYAIEANANGTDVYLMNGPPPPAVAGPPQLPVEVVGIDSPQQGEVFRYEVANQSLWAALDDSGQIWLRIGPDMVKPLPLTQYRAVHPTP